MVKKEKVYKSSRRKVVDEKVKEKVYNRYPRRVLSSKDYALPDASLSVRVLIDRVSKGLPVNAKLSKHIPLPPDGDDMNDFEIGSEEVTDVTEAVGLIDKIKADQKYIEEQKRKAIEKESGKTDVPPVSVTQ